MTTQSCAKTDAHPGQKGLDGGNLVSFLSQESHTGPLATFPTI